MNWINATLLKLAKQSFVRGAVENNDAMRELIWRYFAGETALDALAAAQDLHTKGVRTTIGHLHGGDTSPESVRNHVAAYLELAGLLANLPDPSWSGFSILPSSIGLADSLEVARDNLQRICTQASLAGFSCTLQMEEHTRVDDVIELWQHVQPEFPDLGLSLHARLKRTPDDLARLAHPGVRIRLTMGSYPDPKSVAYTRHQADLAYVRCARALFDSGAYPIMATHDARVIEIIQFLAEERGKPADHYEFELIYGIRPLEQRRLCDIGLTSRCFLPYGSAWYNYIALRIAQQPEVVGTYLKALLVKR